MSFKKLIKNLVKNMLKMFGLCKTYVKVHKQKVPVIGEISMQHTIIDLTDIDNVAIGDEVEIDLRRTTTNNMVNRIYIQTGYIPKEQVKAFTTKAITQRIIQKAVN